MIRGVTNASFSEGEKSAHASDRFVILVRTGASLSMHCLRIDVGTGSRTQDLLGDWGQ